MVGSATMTPRPEIFYVAHFINPLLLCVVVNNLVHFVFMNIESGRLEQLGVLLRDLLRVFDLVKPYSQFLFCHFPFPCWRQLASGAFETPSEVPSASSRSPSVSFAAWPEARTLCPACPSGALAAWPACPSRRSCPSPSLSSRRRGSWFRRRCRAFLSLSLRLLLAGPSLSTWLRVQAA